MKEKENIEKELSYIREKLNILNEYRKRKEEHIEDGSLDIPKNMSDILEDENQYYKLNSKRVAILEERIRRFNKASRLVEIVNVQLKAIEDLFKLIRDQSIMVRDPKEMTKQIDSLLLDMKVVEELEEVIDKMPVDDLDDIGSID